MSLNAAEFIITGTVQGVGYRYFCLQQAKILSLKGWVKNISDGSVMTYVEGDENSILEYLNQLKIGPAHASVSNVETKWLIGSNQFTTFDITS